MLDKVKWLLRRWHDNLQARVAKFLITRRVTRVLKLTHAQELGTTPRNEWPLVMQKQAEEIRAVASGKIDIVDRRSWATPYLPEALHRLNQPVIKSSPYNIRRFANTPIPRRAINLIKNALLSLDWKIVPTKEHTDEDPERELRIRILTETLKRPNNVDSFRDLFEAILEDHLCLGAAVIEPRVTPYFKRPFKLWSVDASTIRLFLDWTESLPDRPKYAQMTGLKGERGIVTFLADELVYIRDNINASTPFGTGCLEVAFNTVNAFLGVQDMSARAGADQIHKTWLWWEQAVNPGHIQTVRRAVINELEGQAKISLMSGMKEPKVVDVKAVTPEDLLLDWQEFLIRIIANGFDISPFSLGLEKDVNRSTATVLSVADWLNAVVPRGNRFEEAFTRQLIHGILGWKDLQFEFINLQNPDPVSRANLHRIDYMSDSITSDEIRADSGRKPLPGGWGKLTMMQKTAVIQAAVAKIAGKAPGGMGGMGMSTGSVGGGTGGMGGGMGTGSSMPSSMGMSFSAQDVAGMTPEEVEMYQELGILPPAPQLPQQMEQQSPGILDEISDELKEYFDKQSALSQEAEVAPAAITPAMEKEQQKKFVKDAHRESMVEAIINRRRMLGPSLTQKNRQAAQRGKYPRETFGPVGSDQDVRVTNADKKLLKQGRQIAKQSKRNMRPGKGNDRM